MTHPTPTTMRPADMLPESAMNRLREAQREWAALGVHRRARFLRPLRALLAEHSLQLAELAAAARRRPVAEAMTSEVVPLADAAKFLEKNAKTILKPRKLGASGRPLWLGRVRTIVEREPHGVVLVIAPGNYPLFLAGAQMMQALVAGNSVVVKPGFESGAVLERFRELLVESGADRDLISILPDTVEAARAAIGARPDKVVFTGSAGTGRAILTQLAFHLIPATMELSGSDAVIIRADADLRLAADAVAFGLLLNGGATCIAPRRVFVDQSKLHKFEHLLWERLAASEWQLNAEAANRTRGNVLGALEEGARLIHGRVRGDGNVFAPIVLSSVPCDAAILNEEIFAPVVSIVPTRTDDEALTLANRSAYALGASIFSANQHEARALGAKLRAGSVCINDLIVPSADPRLPFGGRGSSGYGVTRGPEGLLEMTAPKVISVTGGKSRPAYETARKGDEQIFADYLKSAHSASLVERARAFARVGMQLVRRSNRKGD